MRSRAVSLPLACCFSTARAEPACVASPMRWLRARKIRHGRLLCRTQGEDDLAELRREEPPVERRAS